ncbi:DUF4302 domain-containing protein [Pedobacter agri]|uniref:DUF4302 domain-containing protein n=1 Tax=Pedobacter agri TaxID=454586 RepID=UPI002931B501|nr:DUF4302 domain-containing protein [Pedobacter agri]
MKKNLYYVSLLMLIFTTLACKKNGEELIDGKKPEQRLSETMAQYKQILTGSDKGWMAYVYPGTGDPRSYATGGYTFYMKFDANGRVNMYSDFDDNSLLNKKESAYALQLTGSPALNFDTYNYIHVLADPDPAINGGINGLGLFGDFEYAFKKLYTDSIILEGKLYNNKMVLVKATDKDLTALAQNTLTSQKTEIQAYTLLNPFLFLNPVQGVNNTTAIFNMVIREVTFNWKNASGQVQEANKPFAVSADKLILRDIFVNGNVSVSGFRFNKATNQLFVIDKDGKESLVRSENNPVETFAERLSIYRFSALRLQKANQTGSGANLYNNTEASMATVGNTLRYIEITRRAADTVIVNYAYYNPANVSTRAYKEYVIKIDNGKVSFTDFVGKLNTSNYTNYKAVGGVGTYVTGFHNFLTQNTFDADYEVGMINGGLQTLGRLKVSTNNSFFMRLNVN